MNEGEQINGRVVGVPHPGTHLATLRARSPGSHQRAIKGGRSETVNPSPPILNPNYGGFSAISRMPINLVDIHDAMMEQQVRFDHTHSPAPVTKTSSRSLLHVLGLSLRLPDPSVFSRPGLNIFVHSLTLHPLYTHSSAPGRCYLPFEPPSPSRRFCSRYRSDPRAFIRSRRMSSGFSSSPLYTMNLWATFRSGGSP